MNLEHFHPTRVLLLTESPDRRRQWVEWLDTPELRLLPADTKVGSHRVDVIVTDRDVTVIWQQGADAEQVPTAGVVAIGVATACDVRLPSDCSRRELRLACQLLGQVVELRRVERRRGRLCQIYQRMSYADSLTELPNRRAWDDRLATLRTPQHQHDPLAVAILDLDLFAAVNRKHGYQEGDRVLREAANHLRSAAKSDVFVARIGGDEFGVLLPHRSDGVTCEAVERLRTSVQHCSTHGPRTAAVGLAWKNSQASVSVDDLFTRADLALRRAKDFGGDRTCIDDEGLP